MLGLSAWSVIFHMNDVRRERIQFPQGRPRTVAAWVFIATGVLFAGLWLGYTPYIATRGKPAPVQSTQRPNPAGHYSAQRDQGRVPVTPIGVQGVRGMRRTVRHDPRCAGRSSR